MKARKLKAPLNSMKWPSAQWISMRTEIHIPVWAGITATRLYYKDGKVIQSFSLSDRKWALDFIWCECSPGTLFNFWLRQYPELKPRDWTASQCWHSTFWHLNAFGSKHTKFITIALVLEQLCKIQWRMPCFQGFTRHTAKFSSTTSGNILGVTDMLQLNDCRAVYVKMVQKSTSRTSWYLFFLINALGGRERREMLLQKCSVCESHV